MMNQIKKILLFSVLTILTNNSQVLAQNLMAEDKSTTNNDFLTNNIPFSTEKIQLAQTNNLEPINNVSQLRDVAPTDWAYEALRNLTERYQCLTGYQDNTFKGKQAITREEFAFSLQTCLRQMEGLMTTGTRSVSEEDLATLTRLKDEFNSELTSLSTKIDGLEARIGVLENQQFSTTTKLFGNLVVQNNFFLSAEGESNMQYNAFFALMTSFTGKDNLFIGLASTNTTLPEIANTNNGRYVGSTREGTAYAASAGDLENDLRMINLAYDFPIGDNIKASIVGVNRFNFAPTFLSNLPFDYVFGKGPVSAFATAPPIYLVGGGNGGASLNYKITDSTVLSLTYQTTLGSEPSVGLFGGDYVAAAEIKFNPSRNLFLQALYQKGYFGPGNFGFNNGQAFRGNGFVGTGLANRFDDAGVLFDEASAVSTNAYQIGGYYAFNPQVSLGGWVNYIDAELHGKGNAEIWSYSLQLAFPDLFKEGNLGGVVVGVEPMLTGLSTDLPHNDFKNDTSLHLETYYRHQLNDNMSITPYIIWITAPNQDADNSDIVVGGFRTIFSF